MQYIHYGDAPGKGPTSQLDSLPAPRFGGQAILGRYQPEYII